MALVRTETVIEEAKTAQHSDIKGFSVDVFGKSLSIQLVHGTYENGVFTQVSQETITIRDQPDTEELTNEDYNVDEGRITLNHTPTEPPILSVGGDFLAEGTHFSIEGKVVTIMRKTDSETGEDLGPMVENDVTISVLYRHMAPGIKEFSQLAMQSPDPDKSFFQNLKEILWQSMIDRGLVVGEIV